jgi:hypothetical protein
VISGGDTPMGTAPKDSPRFNADAGERRNGSLILSFMQHTVDFAQLSLPEQQIVNSLLSSTELLGLERQKTRQRERESRSIYLNTPNFVEANQIPDSVAKTLDAITPTGFHAIQSHIRWRERLISVMTRKINSLLELHNSNITEQDRQAELIK